MKKFLFLASAATLMFSSCSDGFEPGVQTSSPVEGKSSITVTVDKGQAESRTSYVLGEYTWSNADAIGVFNAATPTLLPNEPFVYSQGTDNQAEFVGQIFLTEETTYYGYYPFNRDQELGGSASNELTLTIPATQTFNAVAAANAQKQDYNWTYPNGSFVNMLAPMVAVGEATSETEANLHFYPVSSYIVIPVVGYTPTGIKQATLQLKNGGEAQTITGDFTVTMSKDLTATTIASAVGTIADGENEITLNFGSGWTLNLNNPTNFWFVIPAGVTVDEIVMSIDGTVVVDKTWEEVRTTPMNQPIWLTPDGGDTPYQYVQNGGTLITNQFQLLEYINLVTNPEAVAQWISWNDNGNTLGLNGQPLTNLENMVVYAEGKTSISEVSDVEGAKPAIIAVANLPLDAEEVLGEIGSNGTGQYESKLDDYIVNVYGTFANTGAIKPIGGAYGFEMSGLTPTTTITGLNVNGNGMFGTATNSKMAKVSSLTFADCTVTPAAGTDPGYFFFSLMTNGQNGVTLSEVTVADNCSVATDKSALFNEGYASSFASYIQGVTSKPAGMAYYNVLNANSNLDLSDYDLSTDFNLIKIGGWNPVVVTIEDKEQAIELFEVSEVIPNTQNGNKPSDYAVIDATTSYWTGGAYQFGKGYAEDLAYLVQVETESNSANPFVLTMNLDLMGDLETPMHWWNIGSTGSKVNYVNNPNNKTIKNVYIDGFDNDGKQMTSQFFSLLGWFSQVSNLNIEGIVIDNNATDGAVEDAYISAVSGYPYTTGNTATVTGMVVNANAAYLNGVGGLYASLNSSNINRIAMNPVTFGTNGLGNGIKAGTIAGSFVYTVTLSEETLTAQQLGNDGAFGWISVDVTPVPNSSTTVTIPEGYEVEFTSTSTSIKKDYALFVKQGGTTTVYKWNGTAFVVDMVSTANLRRA